MKRVDELSSDSEPEPIGYAISSGWRDLFWWLPRPVIAWRGRDIYRVLVHGSGFELSFPGIPEPARGFMTTRFVAAASVREASDAAFASVYREWSAAGRTSVPTLEADEIEPLERRFVLRSPRGFSFYSRLTGE